MRNYILFLILSASLLVAGCDYQLAGKEVRRETRTDIEAPGVYDSNGMSPTEKQVKFEYIVGPEDLIEIEVERHEEFRFEGRVDGEGLIRMPILKTDIPVHGKSPKQIEADIAWRLRKFVKREPEVKVTVLEVKSKRYLMLGQVQTNAQRFYDMPPREVRLLDALVRARVMANEDADVRQVFIIRPDKRHPTYVKVNAEEVLMGRMENNIIIHDGDVIFVPTKLSTKIDDVVSYILNRTGQGISLDQEFQYYEDLFPGRDLDTTLGTGTNSR